MLITKVLSLSTVILSGLPIIAECGILDWAPSTFVLGTIKRLTGTDTTPQQEAPNPGDSDVKVNQSAQDTLKPRPYRIPKPVSDVEQPIELLSGFLRRLPGYRFNLPCLLMNFVNLEIFSRFLSLLDSLVVPCMNRKPSQSGACEPGVAFQGGSFDQADPVSSLEWPCLQSALKFEDFYVKLNEVYRLLNPCTSLAPKLDISSGNRTALSSDKSVGIWIYGLWWFWWYFISRQVVFHLARRDHEDVATTHYVEGKLFEDAFNASIPTKIIIHGFKNSNNSIMNHLFRIAYLNPDSGKTTEASKFNVIIVDWSSLSYEPYTISRHRIILVAKAVMDVVIRLVSEYGVTLGSIHIIGHSLGAHIAGITGNMVYENGLRKRQGKSKKALKIGRVTALDPAQWLFLTTPNKWRVGRYSARFVDVIHTSDYGLGISSQTGHADFFVNGGLPMQPGCGVGGVLASMFGQKFFKFANIGLACAHARAIFYYVESIPKPKAFLGLTCTSFGRFYLGLCRGNPTTYMGEHVPKKSRGNFYLTTASKPPYGMGKKGI